MKAKPKAPQEKHQKLTDENKKMHDNVKFYLQESEKHGSHAILSRRRNVRLSVSSPTFLLLRKPLVLRRLNTCQVKRKILLLRARRLKSLRRLPLATARGPVPILTPMMIARIATPTTATTRIVANTIGQSTTSFVNNVLPTASLAIVPMDRSF